MKQFEPRILAFTCNWCSYAGADLAGTSRLQYPPNVRIIRLMCSGRVEIPFVLKALQGGADGVLVAGCHIGDCHYIGGNEVAEKRIKTLKELLKMLGIGEDRLRLEWISSAEGQKFADTITGFVERITALGPSEVGLKVSAGGGEPVKNIKEIIAETRAYACLACGKCTGICPMTRNDRSYLPRTLVENAVLKGREQLEKDDKVWSCLTCGMCGEICPSNVKYTEFIKHARIGAQKRGITGECAHLGMLQDMMKLMASEKLVQKRTGWLEENIGGNVAESGGLRTSKQGDILYFTGCLPYFSILFGDIAPNLMNIAKGTVRVMNRAGVEPVVLENERCCGHDLLWSGDIATFRKLAAQNVNSIRKSGVKKIVFSCPECYRAFKLDYPEHLGKDILKGIEMQHVSEFISDAMENNKIRIDGAKVDEKITYHDPCRLGHHLRVYDAPRKVLRETGKFAEMEHSRELSTCCGTSTWLKCDANSKLMQTSRLKEARRVADKMLTACPKCLIHFSCAMSDKDGPEVKIEVEDISEFIDRVSEKSGPKLPQGGKK